MGRHIFAMLAAVAMFIATLRPAVHAADVIFTNERDSCSQDLDRLWCSSADVCANCCYADAPFCSRLSCDNCDGTDLHGFLNSGSCSDAAPKVTACENLPGNACCNDLGDVSTCSGQLWSKARRLSSRVGLPSFTGYSADIHPPRRLLHQRTHCCQHHLSFSRRYDLLFQRNQKADLEHDDRGVSAGFGIISEAGL